MKRAKERGSLLVSGQSHATGHAVMPGGIVATEAGLTVEVRRLETPANTYDADFAWIAERNGTVNLYFAKGNYRNDRALRTRVEVRYARDAFVLNLWQNSREFHDILRKSHGDRLVRYKSGRPDAAALDAEKDHSIWANIDVMSQAGGQGSIAFYLMEANGIAVWSRQRDPSRLVVEPMLRVLLPTEELLLLLDACDPVAQRINASAEGAS